MGPFIYLTSNRLWTVQLGLSSFVGQFDAEYAMIMTGSVISVIPILIIFLVRPAVLHPRHRDERNEVMSVMTSEPRKGLMARVSHESVSGIFTFVYGFLAINVLLALSNAPLVFFMAVVGNPAASWPFFLLLSVTVPPSLAGAFSVFAAIKEANGKDAQPFKTFAAGYGRCFRKTGPTALAAVAVVGVLLVDLTMVLPTSFGALMAPLLVVLVALVTISSVAVSAGAVLVPAARLVDLVKAALFLSVKRWYLSLATLVLLALIVALTLVQPILGAALAPAPLLFIIWSNTSYAITAAVEPVSTKVARR